MPQQIRKKKFCGIRNMDNFLRFFLLLSSEPYGSYNVPIELLAHAISFTEVRTNGIQNKQILRNLKPFAEFMNKSHASDFSMALS